MGNPNRNDESPDEEPQTKPPLGKTCRQFWNITKAFFTSASRRKARGFLAILLTLALAVGGVQVLMSYAGRDFMNDVARRDGVAYWRSLAWYITTFAIAVPIGVFYRWTEERLGLLWREWLTQHLIRRYFNNRAYYQLQGSERVDNPDQRISEDVRNFTISTLSILLIALNS
ncbi:MAG: ABC transporter ATP-binding protein, partial [Verrucomicrobium sp.]